VPIPLFHLKIVILLFPVFYECLLHMHYTVMGSEGRPGENPSLIVFLCEKYLSILSMNFWPLEDDRRRRTESCNPAVCYLCMSHVKHIVAYRPVAGKRPRSKRDNRCCQSAARVSMNWVEIGVFCEQNGTDATIGTATEERYFLRNPYRGL
jgi:hypothetical protein